MDTAAIAAISAKALERAIDGYIKQKIVEKQKRVHKTSVKVIERSNQFGVHRFWKVMVR